LGAAQELQNFRELPVNVLKIKSDRDLCNKRKISARSSARPLLPAAYAAGPEVRYYRGK
jgi:hypothetical protein